MVDNIPFEDEQQLGLEDEQQLGLGEGFPEGMEQQIPPMDFLGDQQAEEAPMDFLGDEQAEDPRKARRTKRAKPKIISDADKEKVLDEVLEKMRVDEDARSNWLDDRLARYAKYRGWMGNKNFPWDNCSNAHLPTMMTHSQRLQDTLHNAVMSIHPVIHAIATKQADKEKEQNVDDLIDTQVFVDQPGEESFGHLIEKFVNDGRFTAYLPWVRDTIRVKDIRILPPFDEQFDDMTQIESLLNSGKLVDGMKEPTQEDEDGYEWSFTVTDSDGKDHKGRVEFFFREDETPEAHIEMPKEVFNGPVIIPKAVEDVVAPWRCGNLQPPGPSNPYGAPHVNIKDYPGLDEILRLKKNGTYDRLSADDVKKLKESGFDKPDNFNSEEMKIQKDDIEGVNAGQHETTKKVFTRVTSYERRDIDGDGLEEDIIITMIREPKVLLRVRTLTEMYPSDMPTRPLFEAQFLPVSEDRLYGISLLELMESLDDITATTINQIIDNGTITNTPFFFYRPGTGMRNDTIRVDPGMGYPLNDPQRDVHFPQFASRSQTEGFNLITMIDQFRGKLTMESDLNFGQIPKGKASALRTASTTQAIMSQGAARPERILRRLFIGISAMYRMIHQMNQRFLPKGKFYRKHGYQAPNENPFRSVDDIDSIRGDFDFDFQASLINTDPSSSEQSIQEIMQILISPMSMQAGTINAEGIYKLQSDFIKKKRVDPSRYMTFPPEGIDTQKIMAEEAITSIMLGREPEGRPLEPAQMHLEKLIKFQESDDFSEVLGKEQLWADWLQKVQGILQEEQRKAQLGQAAQQFQQGQAQGPEGTAPGKVPGIGDNPPVQNGELLDESLPGAGGGANAG
mgnify:CR=1 FL=1